MLVTLRGRRRGGRVRRPGRAWHQRAGSNFYAWEPSHHLGLGGKAGGLRIGLAPYTTEDDIDRLLAALGDLLSPS